MTNRNKIFLFVCHFSLLSYFCLSHSVKADPDRSSTKIYRTPEERRDAGIKHQLTSGVSVAMITEGESSSEKLRRKRSSKADRAKSNSTEFQLILEIAFSKLINSEVIQTFDSVRREWSTEEAIINIEFSTVELSFGRQSLPFGEYYSNFVNGPILEFGETIAPSAIAAIDLLDDVELLFSIYRGRSLLINSNNALDWNVSIILWPEQSTTVGLGYISDITDSDYALLSDSDIPYQNKVSAISAYTSMRHNNFDLNIECVFANRVIQSLETDRNLPRACNIELTHQITRKINVSFRLEGSSELESEPRSRFGMASTYPIINNNKFIMVLTAEVLQGRFRNNLANDDNGEAYAKLNVYSVQLSATF